MMELKGIPKAVREFNNWQGHAEIMLDVSDGEVWCNIYASGNEWKNYHDNNVRRVISKASSQMWERDDKTKVVKVLELAMDILEEGN